MNFFFRLPSEVSVKRNEIKFPPFFPLLGLACAITTTHREIIQLADHLMDKQKEEESWLLLSIIETFHWASSPEWSLDFE